MVITKELFKFGMNRLLDESYYTQIERTFSDSNLKNYRNGLVKRIVSSPLGLVELDVPRDRYNRFKSHDVLKDVSKNFSYYITFLYSHGLALSHIRFLLHHLFEHDYSIFSLKKEITHHLSLHNLINPRKLDTNVDVMMMNFYTLKNSTDQFIIFSKRENDFYKVIGLYRAILPIKESLQFALNDLVNRQLLSIDFMIIDDVELIDIIINCYSMVQVQLSIPEFIKKQAKLIPDPELKQTYINKLKVILNASSYEKAIHDYHLLINDEAFQNYVDILFKRPEFLFNYLKQTHLSLKTKPSLHGFNAIKKRLNLSLTHNHIKKMHLLDEYIDFTIQNYDKYVQYKLT
jgi:transposase-like protein